MREAETHRRALRMTAVPVSYDDLAGDGGRMTLRQAGEKVWEAGGTVRVKGGRLVVSLPPGALVVMGAQSVAAKAAARLYLAEESVTAAASKRGGDVDVAKLPDRPVLPSGAVAP